MNPVEGGPRPDLSLVVPCYQEAEHLRESVARVLATLDGLKLESELIFVDDGSDDGTREILREICADSARCRLILHPENRGRGAAFKTGFRASRGRVAGFLDIDLEVAPHYIAPLFARVDREGYDVATGYRHYLLRQTRAVHRHVASRGYRWLTRQLLAVGLRDTETGCKFFRRDATEAVVLGSASDGWFWDTEVMVRAVLANLRVSELPVLFLRRTDKTSTVHMWRDAWDYWRELRRFRARLGLPTRGRSPIYWTAAGYEALMRLSYGRSYRPLYRAMAEQIPDGASVVDVCAGPATLWHLALRGRPVDYLALDANPRFVIAARRRGAAARLFDLRRDVLPEADYVVMGSSLHHFRPDEEALLDRMRRAARCGVVVSEPVQDLGDREAAWRALIARLTDPGDGAPRSRFDAASFAAFATRGGAARIEQSRGSRNALAVFETHSGGAVRSALPAGAPLPLEAPLCREPA